MGAEEHILPLHYFCGFDAFYSGAFSFANLCDTRCPRLMDSICSERVLLLSPNVLFDIFVICYHTSHLVLYTSLNRCDIEDISDTSCTFSFSSFTDIVILQILSQHDGKVWNMNVIVMVSR